MPTKLDLVTLGELVASLKLVNEDWSVVVYHDEEQKFVGTPGHLDSYRGWYDELAFEPSQGVVSVGELLPLAEGAILETFEGYKGGHYRMDRTTPLWYSDWGVSSNVGIVDIEVDSAMELVILHVSEIDW